MTSEQFAYWLQGFAELNQGPPSAEQWQMIREHLALVFTKVTPPMGWPSIQQPPYPQQPGIIARPTFPPTTTC